MMNNMYSAKTAPKDEDFLSVHSTNSSQSSVFDDEQSESDYFDGKSPVRRSSERVRKSDLGYFEVKKPKFSVDSSSISDATSDEDVAHCLIMMSRDKYWRRVELEYHDQEEVEVEEEDSDVDEKVTKNKGRGKYRCETCHKFFRSYQALGGHRANHKKAKHENSSTTRLAAGRMVAEERVHECPFCDRVFSSGQALGGHKRTHFLNGANLRNATTTITNTTTKSQVDDTLVIDLNLPAPEYDRVPVSAVSGVEFVHPVKC